MPQRADEAILLKAFGWSESSRTAILFSRQSGRLALSDRGGKRLSSKRGRLLPFARLAVSFYQSERSATGSLSESEVLEWFDLETEGHLGRLAYGSAATELIFLLTPEQQPHPELYGYLINYLRLLVSTPKQGLPSLWIAFFLRTLSTLGYHPSLDYCAGCNQPRPKGAEENQSFAPLRGGWVCPTCQGPEEAYIIVPSAALDMLSQLQRSSLGEASTVRLKYREAALMVELLTKFLACQADIRSELKSLEFLEKLRQTALRPD